MGSTNDLVPFVESVDISSDGKTYTFSLEKSQVSQWRYYDFKIIFSFNRSMDMGLAYSYLIKKIGTDVYT